MKSGLNTRKNRWGYFFIIPFFVTFVIFNLYPIIYTVILSFQKWNGFSTPKNIGFENWKRIRGDGAFILTIKNTLRIWIWDFIPQLGVALLLSAIFSLEKMRGMKFFRAVYYLPNLITAASIGLLFNILFNGDRSTVNQLLQTLNITSGPISFFKSPKITSAICSFILWWMWFGYTTILVMAGISGIDDNLYEAAKLDGANNGQVFFRITLPLIRPTLIYITITSIIGGMQIFDVPLNLTNLQGDPQKSILTTSMYIYQQGFKNNNFGYASVLSLLLFMVIAVLSFIALTVSKRREK